MNKCTDSDTQEMLPDLLHGTLAADARARVEAHLATCEECREEVEILRTVKTAAVFAPRIDVDRVVRQIPPYRTIVPATERPASTRMVSWLVAAALAVVVIGGGSLVLTRPNAGTAPSPVATTEPSQVLPSTQPTLAGSGIPDRVPAKSAVATATARPRALALAANVDDLSDGDIVQLMNDMSRFDALPASEPDPVISVDSGATPEQDLR
ncbi:MAG TPA: zf-HC2 domain-containing protein [Gemmatimonadaceae bacterium]|nr:zf-HC2 domain-containing protein [Gemmatimonadaceae bacterium]